MSMDVVEVLDVESTGDMNTSFESIGKGVKNECYSIISKVLHAFSRSWRERAG